MGVKILQAWTTLRARETVALGRELMGANGILVDFHVAKVNYHPSWISLSPPPLSPLLFGWMWFLISYKE